MFYHFLNILLVFANKMTVIKAGIQTNACQNSKERSNVCLDPFDRQLVFDVLGYLLYRVFRVQKFKKS